MDSEAVKHRGKQPINTGDATADKVLQLLLARVDQYVEPHRSDILEGLVWPFQKFNWLQAATESSRSDVVAALIHLQRQNYIETDFRRGVEDREALYPIYPHGSHIRMLTKLVACAA